MRTCMRNTGFQVIDEKMAPWGEDAENIQKGM